MLLRYLFAGCHGIIIWMRGFLNKYVFAVYTPLLETRVPSDTLHHTTLQTQDTTRYKSRILANSISL